jgi:hypothetical protein
MTRLAPVSREELIRKLRILGFEGPFTGGNSWRGRVSGSSSESSATF